MAAAHLEIEGALPLKAIMHAPMLLRRQPDIRELDAIDERRVGPLDSAQLVELAMQRQSAGRRHGVRLGHVGLELRRHSGSG